MSIPPRLASKLNETLGAQAAEDLVSWLDESRTQHSELRADVAELRHEMETRFVATNSAMATKDELHTLGTNLRGEIHGVETRLALQIAGVSNQVEKSAAKLIQWSFVFWVGAVAAVALLAGVLRE